MAHEIASALAANADTATEALLGEPTYRHRTEHRWGNRGSLAVRISGKRSGLWFDHETGEGGDLVDLIARVHGIDRKCAYEVARTKYLNLPPRAQTPSRRTSPVPLESDDSGCNAQIALLMWRAATPIVRTPAATYLMVHRGLDISKLELSHALRWHEKSRAVLGLMTHPVTGKLCGVHRTFLDASARKIDRKMLGKQGVIRISPDEEVAEALGICEGVEDALAVLISGWRPIWAATSAGAIARFPILEGINCLTIFADRDDAGIKAGEACAERWRGAGRSAAIVISGDAVNV